MEPFNWEKSLSKFISDGRKLLASIGSDNMSNALKQVTAIIRERDKYKAHCEDILALTNTTQIGNAKQRISKLMEGATPCELNKLPESFHKPPYIWLSGKYGNEKLDIKGFAPMKPRDAERKHRVILPLLVEVWELSEGNEDERREIEKAYRNWSADKFERELYVTINKLEEPTLEDMLEEKLADSAAEFQKWKENNAKARYKHKD